MKKLLLLLASFATTGAFGSAPLSYNRDVRPILADKCLACHGADKNHREADLRLDVFESATRNHKGVRALVPGSPEKSEVWSRIITSDPDDVMPPPKSHKILSDAEQQLIYRWIQEGATYEPHWAYVPVKRPPVPHGEGAPSHPIDAFIRARLKEEDVAPSPRADAATEARRIALDLTGLPPEPEQIPSKGSTFDDAAYAERVDSLLASPHFGERMALQWLDLVRFANTVGFHGDQPFMSDPYRDYVIKSFNENKSFRDFTIEQLAGDLLPEPTPWQQVATCYNRLNPITAEGGAQAKEYVLKGLADRARTTSVAWLGSSMGCAECHDHKYDPFTTADFYRMTAFWADVEDKGYYGGGNNSRDGWGKVMEAPFYTPSGERDPQQERVALAAERDAWVAAHPLPDPATINLPQILQGWELVEGLTATNQQGILLTPQSDGTLLASGTASEWVTIEVPGIQSSHPIQAISLFLLPHANLPAQGPGAASNGNIVLSEVELFQDTASATNAVKIAQAEALHSQGSFPARNAIDGKVERDNGWALLPQTGKPHQLILRLEKPVKLGENESLRLVLKHGWDPTHYIAHFHVGIHADQNAGFVGEALAYFNALQAPAAEWTTEMRTALRDRVLTNDPQWAAFKKKEEDLNKECLEWSVLAVTRQAPQTLRIRPRGNWMDDSGAIVEPAVPLFLGGSTNQTERLTRLDLAEWIVSEENPLTARTFVNRLWKHFFGTGLSRFTSDLGLQGEYPSHPELLDWLAAEFTESGWDVKHMVRLIVTSETYRQASTPRPALAQRDPYNRLLARQAAVRLPAEVIRDNALAASGLLVKDIGGPSVFPYQPKGYWRELNFPKRTYPQSTGKDLYRRGVYTFAQRTFPHPMMKAFDAPDRAECTADRVASNTPIQALVLLNDPAFVEAAKALSSRILSSPGTPSTRMDFAWKATLSRAPLPDEKRELLRLLQTEETRFQENPESIKALAQSGEVRPPESLPPAHWAAWTSVARVLLNLHESTTRL